MRRLTARHVGPQFVNLDDGTCWPRAVGALPALAHRLRYGGATESDLLSAAEVIGAWEALLGKTHRRRGEIVGALRAIEEQETAQRAAITPCDARVLVGDSDGEERCGNPWPCATHGGKR